MEKRIGVKIKVFGQVDLREFESLEIQMHRTKGVKGWFVRK